MMDEIDGLSSCQQKRRPFSLYVLLFPPSFFFLPTAKALYGTAPGFSLAAVSWNVSQDTP